MFRFLIRFLAASLVLVFHSECLPRVFDVMYPKIKNPTLLHNLSLLHGFQIQRKGRLKPQGLVLWELGPGRQRSMLDIKEACDVMVPAARARRVYLQEALEIRCSKGRVSA